MKEINTVDYIGVFLYLFSLVLVVLYLSLIFSYLRSNKYAPKDSLPMVIAFVHHKGGTGKTTSCINIAGWLAKISVGERRASVVVVDLDPQGNATAGLGIDRKTLKHSIYEVLFDKKPVEQVILETDSGVYLIPSSIDLLAAETHMSGNIFKLKEALSNIKKYFDYILIDAPSGSPLLMINGIAASQNIIISLDTGVFSCETLETLKFFIREVENRASSKVNILKLLLKSNSSFPFNLWEIFLSKKLLKDFFAENKIPVPEIISVPFSRKIVKAQVRGMPISEYAPFSRVGRVYKKIAENIKSGNKKERK